MLKRSISFGSLIRFSVIIAMITLFFYILPELILSFKGSLFALLWAGFAIMLLWSNILRLPKKERRRIFSPSLKNEILLAKTKTVRAKRTSRTMRAMRG